MVVDHEAGQGEEGAVTLVVEFKVAGDVSVVDRSHSRTLVEPRGPTGIGCINDEGTGVDSASVELAEGVTEQGEGQATFAPGGTYPNLTDPAHGPLLAHLKPAQGHSRDLVTVSSCQEPERRIEEKCILKTIIAGEIGIGSKAVLKG
jgi:hypothetical protein